MARPDWEEWFLEIAKVVSTRSQCIARQVGAVLVRDNHIIATGYNGVASGYEPCPTCYKRDSGFGSGVKGSHLCPAVHAEANAIAQAAKMGISTEYSSIYINTDICKDCVILLINAGVKEITYITDGKEDKMAIDILKEDNHFYFIRNGKVISWRRRKRY